MKKQLLLFIPFILFCIVKINAQLAEEYLPATLTFTDKTIVQGFIKNDEISKLNFQVYFKNLLNEVKPAMFKASEIENVNFSNGENYKQIFVMPHYKKDSLVVLGRQILKGSLSIFEIFYKGENILVLERNGITYPLQNNIWGHNALAETPYYFKNYFIDATENKASLKAAIFKMKFDKNEIIKLVMAYNNVSNVKNTLLKLKHKPVRFLMVDFGGNPINNNDNEVFGQLIYRTFFPKISRSASLNLGLNVFIANFNDKYDNLTLDFKQTLITFPIQLQQNILNKKIRPYVFAGANFSFVKLKEKNNTGVTYPKGFQSNFGFAALYGMGIEADIALKLRLKTELRFENYEHVFLFGIGYYIFK